MNAPWRLTAAAAVATVLTALSLSPTLATGEWLLPLALTVVVVGAAAGAARQAGLPRAVVTLVALAALVVAVTIGFARAEAVLGFLPGPAAWQRLLELADQGLTVIWRVAPPVPSTRGVELVIVAGVGLVAVVVDAVAVTWRKAAAAGLPLLVLYLVPAAVLPEGVPWPLFVLSALGWLGILMADGRDRLRRWGRIVTVRGGHEPAAAVGGTARRLGAAAVATAVVVPLALPMLSEGVFGHGAGGDGDGGGSGEAGLRRVVTVNPLVNLRRDLVRGADTLVLRYVTDDPTPEYLRIATLDAFDGRTWTLEQMQATASQQARDGLPEPPGLDDAVLRADVTSSFEVVGLNSPRLPLPYPATQVEIAGDWRWDGDTFDVFTPELQGTAQGVSYVARSLALAPTVEQLRAAGAPGAAMEHYLDVPPFTSVELGPLADRVVGQAPTTYDAALALQNWFRSQFSYSLAQAGGNGLSDLQSFLADRSGYCEQFAATMALMARTVGIPSRVQVGFTPGSRQPDGSWEVTAHDAHAWPELWFDGVGWVRFEPTPGGGDGGGTPSWAPVPVGPGAGGGGGGPDGQDDFVLRRPSLDGAAPGGAADPLERNLGRRTADEGAAAAEPAGAAGLPLWPFALAAGLLVGGLLALPALVRSLGRRRRWASAGTAAAAADVAWRQVLDTAVDLDLTPQPTETPRDLAGRLPRDGRLSAAGRAALHELAVAVERARYAPAGTDEGDPGHLRALADAVEADLMSGVAPRDRRLARWWPASGRAQVAVLVGAVGARVDRGIAAVGRAVRSVSGRGRRDAGPSALRSGA